MEHLKMFSKKKFRFALVGHSEELATAVRSCVNPETEAVTIKVVNMGESVTVAKQLVEEGVEIIFGHMGNAQLMLQEIGQPVVEIPRTHLDMMEAFVRAKKHGQHIGLTSFRSPTEGIDFIEKVLDIRIHQIVFETFAEMEREIDDAYAQGIRVMVGGGVSNKIITSLGGKGIVVEPRKSAVEKALQEARAIASMRRKEAENSARIQTILQMIEDGVIGVDNFGRIDIYNETAGKILGINLKHTMGQSHNKILKDTNLMDVLTSGRPEIDIIKNIGRDRIMVNTLPIHIDGRPQGAVALFKTISRIQNINRKLQESLYSKGFVAKHTIDDLVGKTRGMRKLKTNFIQYAQTDITLMIQGETGTGKDLVAQAIHNLSRRSHQPFVAINCAALPESLLESELFGYEEGAFTGAKRGGKIGLFELANQGTVFLDEIADISASLQMRLLRVIENKEVMRVGGDRYVPVDVRVISSSYKDLRKEIRNRRFRPDLYYRLAVLKLKIPPLRERTEDMAPILEQTIAGHGKTPQAITGEMFLEMTKHHWPGNIRELISFVQGYLILLNDKACDRELFNSLLEQQMEDAGARAPEEPSVESSEDTCMEVERRAGTLKEMIEGYERTIITDRLKDCHYNKKETARQLGISVNTLWRKMNSA
jgi:propionate catabolism operon transcriptional regulator